MQSIELDNVTSDDKSRKDNVRSHRLFTQTVYDFAENTTLNGLKYMAENGISCIERLFWITTFILSTVLCGFMVYKAYDKYDTSGVAVTLKEHLVSVNEYPFPAITICPQARIRQSKYNFTKIAFKNEYMPTSESELRKLHSMIVFCDSDDVESSNTEDYPFLNYSIDIGHFYGAAPKHEDIFEECWWRNKVDCKNSFRPVLTSNGICYTFNTLATDELFRKKSVYQRRYYLNTSTAQKGWSLEKKYYDIDNNTFPRRGRANVAIQDLFVVLKDIPDRDFACDRQTQPGYEVYFHHPTDLPHALLHSYSAQPGETTSFAIKLDIIDTAKELAGYSPQTRQCYLPNEKYLQLFQKYSSLNCELECLTNYTIQICGCVNYYMPHNKSTPICKADQYNCTEEALDEFANEEDSNKSILSSCECLPSCEDVSYDAEVTLSKLDLEEYFKRDKELNLEQEDDSNNDYEDDDDMNYYEPESGEIEDSYIQINASEGINLSVHINPTVNQSDNETVTNIDDNADTKLTIIRMYYRRPRFLAMERSELIGLSQFLSDVGGTLGLFLGFSVLTLAEILYFFTLKMCCKYRQERNVRTERIN